MKENLQWVKEKKIRQGRKTSRKYMTADTLVLLTGPLLCILDTFRHLKGPDTAAGRGRQTGSEVWELRLPLSAMGC